MGEQTSVDRKPRWRGRFVALFAVVPWAALLGFSQRDDASRWSITNWISWRDSQIQRILEPTVVSDDGRLISRDAVIARSAEAYDFLAPFLRDPEFLGNPERGKVLRNMVRFIGEQRRMAVLPGEKVSASALGMDVTDREYWTRIAPWVRFPKLLESQEFLKLMRAPAGYRQAVEMIESQNRSLPTDRKWITVPLETQFIKSVDKTTYGRLLVLVPGERTPEGKIVDRWVFFAIATPGTSLSRPQQSVSMVTTVRDPNVPGRQDAYLADFLRIQSPQTERVDLEPNFLSPSNPSKNCFDCHKTAVLPIHAKSVFRFGAKGDLVDDPTAVEPLAQMTDRLIHLYGTTRWGRLEPGDFGPTLGSARRPMTDAAIAETANDVPLSQASWERVRKAMDCAKCHSDLATINYPLALRTDRDVISFKGGVGMVQTYIEKGLMPPGNTLSPLERHALWQCLMREYYDSSKGTGLLIDWLKGSCR